VTLLAAIFAIARSTTLSDVEKAIATVFIVLIATFGIVFLFKLQDHLKAVRKELVKEDTEPWRRGVDVLFVLAGIVFISAVLVFYFLWVPHKLLC
jgi:predicted membrane channel-forming protein YqfA (hemolysin III family)